MQSEVVSYLKKHKISEPLLVDKLIVTAFVKKNNLSVKWNLLIKSYLIHENSKGEYNLLIDFVAKLDSINLKYNFEDLVRLFECVISPEERIITGAVYTPEKVRNFIVSKSLVRIDRKEGPPRVADISCGCGGFLLSAAKRIKKSYGFSYAKIYAENIYGLDIEQYSINRTKILLCLWAIINDEDKVEFKFNLFKGDALNFAWNEVVKEFAGFSAILGNPPYVCSRNIVEPTKSNLKNWSVCATGHPDLYIPFFQIGIELLVQNGILGFITMNSFFKSLNGRALRSYFHEKSLAFDIYDFGTNQVFDNRSTYTCICLIQKRNAKHVRYSYLTDIDNVVNLNNLPKVIPYALLNAKGGWNLRNTEILAKIEKVGRPFSEIYKTRNGIATLKNDIFIFKPAKEDRNYFYLGKDEDFPIEKGICLDIVNPNRLIQIDNVNEILEKVIFPYKFVGDRTQLISENYLMNNFPQAYRYLKTKRSILQQRDKGNGNYEKWFAFGRTQSLDLHKYKLFFPHITPNIPNFVVSLNEHLMFYNGIAVLGESKKELEILRKVMSSKLFWFYIKNSSKPYSSGYYSLSKNYIKNFGIYEFTDAHKTIILNSSQNKVDALLENLYEVKIP